MGVSKKKGEFNMEKFTVSKSGIESFLKSVNEIITSPTFKIENDFEICYSDKSQPPDHPNTTKNTLLNLGYVAEDVLNVLRSLTIQEYSHCVPDDKQGQIYPFYVFFREIQGRIIYIKFKTRMNKNKLFCVSFHFDDYPNEKKSFPYCSC